MNPNNQLLTTAQGYCIDLELSCTHYGINIGIKT